MLPVKKILYYILLINMYLVNSLTAYTHTIINKYNKDVEVDADTIGGRNDSIALTAGLTTPTQAQLDTQDLCIRGFKVRVYDMQKKKWRWLGKIKTKSVTTYLLGEPAIARGCMDYQLTIEKNGSLSLIRLGVPAPK